jgi:hypothetical protein
MATDPRIPLSPRDTQNRRPELVPPAPKRPGSGLPGLLFAIIVAAALIAAIVYYMPRAPKKSPAPTGAQAPVQPTPNQLQFSALHLALGPTGNEMTLQGQLMNAGNRPILGASVQLAFMGANGQVVGRVIKPLEGMVAKGGVLQTDDFGTDPIKPNQTRAFRVTVSPVPAGWNHQMPQMTVMTVSAEGSGK